jgi:hypothetical protein
MKLKKNGRSEKRSGSFGGKINLAFWKEKSKERNLDRLRQWTR